VLAVSSLVKPYPARVETFRLQVVVEQETFREGVGRRIRAARERAGLSQNELARLLPGAPAASQVSRWERGEAMPSPENLQALARALDVSIGSFFDDPDH
jgi:ribosome-binding protein aMBF1 (putative translation factor)